MEEEQKDAEQEGKAGSWFSIAGFEGIEGFVAIMIGGVAYVLCKTGIIPLYGPHRILFMIAIGAVAGLVAHFSGKLVALLRGGKQKDEEENLNDIVTRKEDMQ